MTGLDDAAAQHVVRTLRVLELLAEHPQTQADIANRLEIHRRTARRLIGRLVQEGYAEPTQRGRFVHYAPTPRITVLGRQVADTLDLVELGCRHLRTFPQDKVEARFVAQLEGNAVRYAHLEGVDGTTAIEPGGFALAGPLHATAAGKVFLSADNSLTASVLSQELLAFTNNTLTDRGDLLLELATARARGFAVEDGEHRTATRAVAAGVVNHAGRTVAALGATPRPGVGLPELGSYVRNAAVTFSKKLFQNGLSRLKQRIEQASVRNASWMSARRS